MIVLAVVTLAGCDGMSETEQRTLTGGAAATAGGAIIGAAIGGATGLAGSFLYGKHEESKQQAYQQGVADGYQKAQQAGGSR